MTPKDEIPGHTTYLHEANRYREPYEYVLYWKQERETERLREVHDLKGYNELELIGYINELGREKSLAENEVYDLEDKVEEHKKLAMKAKSEEKVAKQDLKFVLTQFGHYKQYLRNFGGHLEDCTFMEALRIGRSIDVKECSCGWNNLREALEVAGVKKNEG